MVTDELYKTPTDHLVDGGCDVIQNASQHVIAQLSRDLRVRVVRGEKWLTFSEDGDLGDQADLVTLIETYETMHVNILNQIHSDIRDNYREHQCQENLRSYKNFIATLQELATNTEFVAPDNRDGVGVLQRLQETLRETFKDGLITGRRINLTCSWFSQLMWWKRDFRSVNLTNFRFLSTQYPVLQLCPRLARWLPLAGNETEVTRTGPEVSLITKALIGRYVAQAQGAWNAGTPAPYTTGMYQYQQTWCESVAACVQNWCRDTNNAGACGVGEEGTAHTPTPHTGQPNSTEMHSNSTGTQPASTGSQPDPTKPEGPTTTDPGAGDALGAGLGEVQSAPVGGNNMGGIGNNNKGPPLGIRRRRRSAAGNPDDDVTTTEPHSEPTETGVSMSEATTLPTPQATQIPRLPPTPDPLPQTTQPTSPNPTQQTTDQTPPTGPPTTSPEVDVTSGAESGGAGWGGAGSGEAGWGWAGSGGAGWGGAGLGGAGWGPHFPQDEETDIWLDWHLGGILSCSGIGGELFPIADPGAGLFLP